MRKPTAGKWEAKFNCYGAEGLVVATDPSNPKAHKVLAVLDLEHEPNRANAKLMAAAPELLAMLREFVEFQLAHRRVGDSTLLNKAFVVMGQARAEEEE